MTKIVSNPENDRSFLVHRNGILWLFGDRKLFERSVGLVMLWLGLNTSDIELAELLYISMEARPGVFVVD